MEIAAVAGPFDKNESVRLVLPCRDREVSNISGGVMFDWGLLAPPVLFLFVNRLPGNVVIIVAEASICSFRGGGEGGWGAALVSNPFSQVLMGGRGVEGVDVGEERRERCTALFHLPRSVGALSNQVVSACTG